jgi:hypothetical protein
VILERPRPRFVVPRALKNGETDTKKWSYPGMEKAVQTMRKQIEGVSSLFTLEACRHGGMTELEEAELTDGGPCALWSQHGASLQGVRQRNDAAFAATRKRHAHRLMQRQIDEQQPEGGREKDEVA